MHFKNLSPKLLEGFGEITEDTDEIERLFDDHDVFAIVRELPLASSRFWIFELGAKNDEGVLVLRSTPFVPLGDTVDEAAEQAELMITYRNRARDGSLTTGQLWAEYAQWLDPPMTNTIADDDEDENGDDRIRVH